MTGRYQSRFGYEYNPSFSFESGPEAGLGLPVTETTLADVLQGSGYATGLVGKWHLGIHDEYHPLNRGFDEFYGVFGGSSYIDSRLPGTHSWPAEGAPTERDPHIARAIIDGRDPVDVPEYLTDVFAAKAVDFIDRHAGGPFFLMLALTAPHTPIQATDEYVDRNLHIEAEGARIYAAMVSSVDDTVGDVVGTLKAHGLDANTLVFFISDNGCVNYMPDVICTNAPLSGGKRYQFEGGIRVPFIAAWPDALPAGRVYDEPVISLDIFATATATAAAGLEPRAVDGVNLLPHLKGEAEAPPHEFLFWRSAPNVAVRWGDWKLWRVDRSERESRRGDERPGPTVAARELPARVGVRPDHVAVRPRRGHRGAGEPGGASSGGGGAHGGGVGDLVGRSRGSHVAEHPVHARCGGRTDDPALLLNDGGCELTGAS